VTPRGHAPEASPVAPITSRIRGLCVEVPVGPENGPDQRAVINLDNIQTIDAHDLGRQIGWFTHDQEGNLANALWRAFDLWAD
jgi:mRNA-degrading endonuclease toxin of MazEF toxin-antitoxin module